MIRIGEFSKLAKTTVKTLRFYEEEGLLIPARVDEWTGYRYYTTQQLYSLSRIVSLRQAGVPITAIKRLLAGEEALPILEERLCQLEREKREAERRLAGLNTIIKELKEKRTMDYQATVKTLDSCTVFYKRGKIKDFSELTRFILQAGEQCRQANPSIKCLEPDYCFVRYLDKDFKPADMEIEYAQAIVKTGKERETADVRFRDLESVTAVCVYHKGAYSELGSAYAYGVNWAKENGWQLAGAPRERYIDGVWNRDDESQWLTEIQFPVVKHDDEVRDRWGDTAEYAQSKRREDTRSAGEELDSVRAAEKIFDEFAAIRHLPADGTEAQELVKKWQEHITRYHYECSRPVLACLAEMYEADERFKTNLDSHGEGTAHFMAQAIKAYCK